MQTYDPTKCSLSVLGHTVQGYADGTFIKASFNEDAFTIKVGADGSTVRIRNANQTGRFEITLMPSSPSNDVLSAFANLDRRTGEGVGTTFVKDGSGTANAMAAESWIVKNADLERGKELGDVTWIIECKKLELNNGGTLDL